MLTFILSISILALLMSKIALFFYIVYSFLLEYYRKNLEEPYINREKRKIKVPIKDSLSIITETKKIRTRKKTLILTIIIGEIVGYIFLALSQHSYKFTVLEINGFQLLVGSLICQFLNLLNAWTRKQMHIYTRLTLQLGLIFMGLILFEIVTSHKLLQIDKFLIAYVFTYFATVVIAVFSMLLDGLFAKQNIYQFDYNNYHRFAILLGLVIASGIYFHISLNIS